MKERFYGIAINPKYDGFQRGLGNMVYEFFNKKIGSAGKESVNEELPQELLKLVIKKLKRRRVYARFKNYIWEIGSLGLLSWDQ